MGYEDFYTILDYDNFLNLHHDDILNEVSTPAGGNATDGRYGHRYSTSLSILFIFGSLVVGALVRQILKKYHFPYTVIVFLVGATLGVISHQYEDFRLFTAVTNVNPEIIMQLFLPVLIFESAYSTDAHMFMTSISQSLTLALPGLLFCTGLAAVYAKSILNPYGWDWTTAFIFGSILSATDPVAVVALLKECGITPTLTTLIEGESLLNDGSAIVIFEVLLGFKHSGATVLPVDEVVWKFVKIGVGTPIFGYFMGLFAVKWLGSVYKDPVIEFIISVCAAYVTYYMAQAVMHMSGVLAVVVLGVVFSYNKSSFEPRTQQTVHNFWETLTYFANTLIFIIVGVIVTEKGLGNISFVDFLLAVCTYFTVTVFRMLMTLLFSPILTRVGYGLPWKHAIILTWGGLRGAVGLALSLILAEEKSLNEGQAATQILQQLSMVVLLTLVVNGTTMKYLLKVLGMSGVSIGHRIAMAHAVGHLRDVVAKTEDALKRDKYLGKSNWLWVESKTWIVDPYSPTDDIDPSCMYVPHRKVECPECHIEQRLVPTDIEKEEMFEEARLRVLAALKVLYWKYFEHGLISRRTVRILVSSVDDAADQHGKFVDFKRLRERYMAVPRILLYLRRKLQKLSEVMHVDIVQPPRVYLTEMHEQSEGFRRTCIGLYMTVWFEPAICLIVILNIVPIMMQIFQDLQKSYNTRVFVFVLNTLFLLAYIAEAFIKIYGLGFRKYFHSRWNGFDLFLVILGVIDYIVDLCFLALKINLHSYVAMVRLIRLVRLVEMYRVLMIEIARLVFYLKYLSSKRLYEAFDLGYGYIHAQQEVMEKIDFIVDYKPCGLQLAHISEIGVLEILKELTIIRKSHPGIADAQKSHAATKRILNDVKSALAELREHGVVDQIEYECVDEVVDKAIYDVLFGNKYPPQCKTVTEILKRVDWLADSRLQSIVLELHENRQFRAHQIINDYGTKPHGVYVIISGNIKVHAKIEPKTEVLPNVDSLLYFASTDVFSDYMVAFETLGLLGFLQGSPYVTTAICETDVEAIYISERSLRRAEAEMLQNPTLEYLLWRNISLKIAERIILELPAYQGMALSKVRLKLENAIIPNLSQTSSFDIGPGINDIVLIQGIAYDENKRHTFIGPTYVPTTLAEIFFESMPGKNRVIMVIMAEESYLLSSELDWSGVDSVPSQERLCLLHTVQHRRQTISAYQDKKKKKSRSDRQSVSS